MNPSPILVLRDADTVGVAVVPLAAGMSVETAAGPLALRDDIPLGHKVALKDIAVDEIVLKLGFPVGAAKRGVKRGEHVHMHNLRSTYITNFSDRDDTSGGPRS